MINKKEKLFSILPKDFIVKPYKGSGAGGQKKNKTSSAIYIKHNDSGAIGKCEDYREQPKNRREALKRLVKTKEFKKWFRIKSLKECGTLAIIENELEKIMKNVLIEVKNKEGRWIDETSSQRDNGRS